MLYLTRKAGEAVLINEDIEVRVIEVRGRTVKLGFSYPQGATVVREEIAGPLRAANREAAEALRDLSSPSQDPTRSSSPAGGSGTRSSSLKGASGTRSSSLAGGGRQRDEG